MEFKLSETISVTDIQRRAKTVFERVESGEQEKYVILKNNEVAAVLLPAKRYEELMERYEELMERYEELMDELADLRKRLA